MKLRNRAKGRQLPQAAIGQRNDFERREPARRSVLIVDDHPVIRAAVVALVEGEADFGVCVEAADADEAMESLRKRTPDAAIVDISLSGASGIELLKLMLAEQPKLPVLMLSMFEESLYALRVLKAGAKGYVMKSESPDVLLAALRKVLTGEVYISPEFRKQLILQAIQSMDGGLGSPLDVLSDRELEVLRHLGEGRGTTEIARSLNLGGKTIETHRSHLKVKLGLKDGKALVSYALDFVAEQQSQERIRGAAEIEAELEALCQAV